MSVSTLESDLEYIRELAEAGQTAPLLGGRFLSWWGGMMTLAYSGHFLIASGYTGLGPEAIGGLWLAFGIIGLGGFFFLLTF